MKFLPSSLVYFEPENTVNNKLVLTSWYTEQEKTVCTSSDWEKIKAHQQLNYGTGIKISLT